MKITSSADALEVALSQTHTHTLSLEGYFMEINVKTLNLSMIDDIYKNNMWSDEEIWDLTFQQFS